ANVGDQRAHTAILMAAHLLGEREIAHGFFIAVENVYFSKDFMQLVVVDRVMLFAKAGQQKIHVAAEGAAQVVDPHSAAVRKRIWQGGGDDQHGLAAGRPAIASATERNIATAHIGLDKARAASPP